MSFSLWAQTAPSAPNSTIPDPSQEQRRQQERERLERERLQTSPDVRLPSPVTDATAASHLRRDESPCFVLRDIALRGDQSAHFGWLLSAVAGPQGDDEPRQQCLGAQGIALVVQRTQDALIARGYVTSRVVVEPQDFQSGHLLLTLLPGRIHAIRFAPGSSARATGWNAVPVQPGDILNLRDVEQALENFKRVPSAEADIQIEPAEVPGTSDLVISWKQPMPFRVNLALDDSGSKATGKNQGSATISLDDLWTLNDLFYFTGNQSLGGALGHPALRGDADNNQAGPRGTQGHAVYYAIPYGYWLLSASHSQSRYYQNVAGANRSIVYSGTSANSDIKLARLVYRDQSRKTTASLRGFQRRSNNFIDDTEVEVQRRVVGGWELGLGHKEFLGRATLEANLAYKHGTGAFGAQPAPEEAFGEGTSRFSLFSADASLNAPFTVAGQALRYSGSWRAQWNRSPLTPQDRFAIGGRYSVRGFDGESSLSAERGWLVRQEIGLALGATGQEVYVGLDHGEVSGPSADTLVGRRITGAVIGVRGAFKGLGYELFVGQPVRQPEGFKTAGTTAGFSLSWSF